MLSEGLIKRLRNDSAFKEFQDHILNEAAKLDSVAGLEKMTNEEAGETVRAKSMALTILKEIFEPIVDFREKVEHPPEEIQKSKDKFGI